MKKESEVAGEGESQCVEREQAGEAVIKGDRWQEQEESNVARGWRALEEAAEMWGRDGRVSGCRGGTVGINTRPYTKIFPMQELRRADESLAVGLCSR